MKMAVLVIGMLVLVMGMLMIAMIMMSGIVRVKFGVVAVIVFGVPVEVVREGIVRLRGR